MLPGIIFHSEFILFYIFFRAFEIYVLKFSTLH